MIQIKPFAAERQHWKSESAGGMSSSWQPCTAIGVVMQDNDPAYVVEYHAAGMSYLSVETFLRRPTP